MCLGLCVWVRSRRLLDFLLAALSLLDGFWLTMPTKRAESCSREAWRGHPIFSLLFGPHTRGPCPLPQEAIEKEIKRRKESERQDTPVAVEKTYNVEDSTRNGP